MGHLYKLPLSTFAPFAGSKFTAGHAHSIVHYNTNLNDQCYVINYAQLWVSQCPTELDKWANSLIMVVWWPT